MTLIKVCGAWVNPDNVDIIRNHEARHGEEEGLWKADVYLNGRKDCWKFSDTPDEVAAVLNGDEPAPVIEDAPVAKVLSIVPEHPTAPTPSCTFGGDHPWTPECGPDCFD